MAHVSVRALHHYDEIGLLVPGGRSSAGYRLYSEADLSRLQRILLLRELDFTLEAIRGVIDQPTLDERAALRAHRALLVEKERRAEAVLRALDRTLESMEKGKKMNTEEMFDGLGELGNAPPEVVAHHAQHGAEAKDRWGDTDAYKESMRRTRAYGKADWKKVGAESEALEAAMATLLGAGEPGDGRKAMDGAEGLRMHIERWFYPCSPAMHVALADMYEADERFKAHYEQRAPGLASYVAGAIRANAARLGAGDAR
jgi:DNA-binding transcriptional MerR regulator